MGTMRIRCGYYMFMVMLFDLCNVPLTFVTFMNSIFHDKLDKYIIVYINDISGHCKLLREHAQHLEYVLQKKNNKLYANWGKMSL
jgi:hypothetical protein